MHVINLNLYEFVPCVESIHRIDDAFISCTVGVGIQFAELKQMNQRLDLEGLLSWYPETCKS